MARGKASGHSLTKADIPFVFGMQKRGDREHDIAAWFGVNQGRVAEVKDGRHPGIEPSPADKLPPKGPPGIKGRRLRSAVVKAIVALNDDDAEGALAVLNKARERYDANEA